MEPDELSDLNVGWWHLKALRFVAQRGQWPEELSTRERHAIRRAGLVELIYRGRSQYGPRMPSLTRRAKQMLEGI